MEKCLIGELYPVLLMKTLISTCKTLDFISILLRDISHTSIFTNNNIEEINNSLQSEVKEILNQDSYCFNRYLIRKYCHNYGTCLRPLNYKYGAGYGFYFSADNFREEMSDRVSISIPMSSVSFLMLFTRLSNVRQIVENLTRSKTRQDISCSLTFLKEIAYFPFPLEKEDYLFLHKSVEILEGILKKTPAYYF